MESHAGQLGCVPGCPLVVTPGLLEGHRDAKQWPQHQPHRVLTPSCSHSQAPSSCILGRSMLWTGTGASTSPSSIASSVVSGQQPPTSLSREHLEPIPTWADLRPPEGTQAKHSLRPLRKRGQHVLHQCRLGQPHHDQEHPQRQDLPSGGQGSCLHEALLGPTAIGHAVQ